jgi:ATP-dependent protease ClpP protease subunit
METVQIPRKMLEDIYDAHEKIDQILETLEVLMDEATLKRLKKGEEELEKGDYVDAKPEEIEVLLR